MAMNDLDQILVNVRGSQWKSADEAFDALVAMAVGASAAAQRELGELESVNYSPAVTGSAYPARDPIVIRAEITQKLAEIAREIGKKLAEFAEHLASTTYSVSVGGWPPGVYVGIAWSMVER
jgi:hypothetical protein